MPLFSVDSKDKNNFVKLLLDGKPTGVEALVLDSIEQDTTIHLHEVARISNIEDKEERSEAFHELFDGEKCYDEWWVRNGEDAYANGYDEKYLHKEDEKWHKFNIKQFMIDNILN